MSAGERTNGTLLGSHGKIKRTNSEQSTRLLGRISMHEAKVGETMIFVVVRCIPSASGTISDKIMIDVRTCTRLTVYTRLRHSSVSVRRDRGERQTKDSNGL